MLCLIGGRAIGQGLAIEAVLRLQDEAAKLPRQDLADPGIEDARLRADAPLASGPVPTSGGRQGRDSCHGLHYKNLDKWTNIAEKMVGKCCSWPHRFVEALTSHDHKDRRAGAGPVLVVHVISLQIRGIRSRKMTDLLLKPQGFRRHCERNSWQCPAGTQQKMQLKESHV